ncbi:MAG: ABC transporter ATP-binding protein [Gammaproteobacteria bacterium]|nr:MAG: ABC transporter ATP-binding protein [Gammaproteobacteria bacterium]
MDAAMEVTDCAHLADRDAMTLSGGESVRVLLARALAVEAPILLADEPLAGLDPAHQLDVLARLKQWVSEGRSAVVVMHDLTLAARFADRVWLLHEGHLIGDGAPDEVLTDTRLAQAMNVQVIRGEHAGQRFMIPWDPLP